jgi:hypothetical protein
MIALLWFFLTLFASPFRLSAERDRRRHHFLFS